MNIEEAIGALKRYKRLGVKEVLIPRDFCPGGEFTFQYIPVPESAAQIAWVVETEDQITRMHNRAMEDYNKVNELLRTNGFEYPTGSRGVRDVIKMWRDALADLKEYQEAEKLKDVYPTVVVKKQLEGLDDDGSECEVCNASIKTHDWVVMDRDGFALFCSEVAS